jgi:hypothetical protein
LDVQIITSKEMVGQFSLAAVNGEEWVLHWQLLDLAFHSESIKVGLPNHSQLQMCVPVFSWCLTRLLAITLKKTLGSIYNAPKCINNLIIQLCPTRILWHISLNHPMDDRNFRYITKLKNKRNGKKKTLTPCLVFNYECD